MLTDLLIRNFAIIDNLHVEFRPGLNILTGETGAGKSIIIDAVNLVLGGRASADLVRTDEEEATVEALFDLSGQQEIIDRLRRIGVETEGELTVKRVVSRSGRNRVFVGGSLSTIAALGDIAGRLINIYGQHESQTLLRVENHLHLLDLFGGCREATAEFARLFDEYRTAATEAERLKQGEMEALRRIDLLAFQSEEIAKAALQPDEDESLHRERELLAHAEKLFSCSQGAYGELYESDRSVLGRLTGIISSLTESSRIDPSLAPLLENLQGAQIQLEDAALELRDYAGRIEADPARLQEVEERIDLINRLKRKYAPSLAGILAYKEESDRELAELQGREGKRGELEELLASLKARMSDAGTHLSQMRQAAGERLKTAMEQELRQLAMPNARFELQIQPATEARRSGFDRVEFLFSPNPGEPPRPLAKVASGGELSRLMLALKQVLPESDVPTLVFDEVDTGIGGAVSALVGRKLKRVAKEQQVLCITHLPQVAVFADSHFRVEKRISADRTTTGVQLLEPEERTLEIARMLGGMKVTEKTLEHAREMIEESAAG